MANTYPDLTGVGTYLWSSNVVYKYNANPTPGLTRATTLGPHEIVYSYTDSTNNVGLNTWPEHDIKYDVVLHTWGDYGNGNPNVLTTDSNGDIELTNDTTTPATVLFRFTPTVASGSSSGAGPSTPSLPSVRRHFSNFW